METAYYCFDSRALGKKTECKIYGHHGRPVLYIPCQDGRFYDFENFHMSDAWAKWIDAGEVFVCSIDTIDSETWSNIGGDPRRRICRYEQWISYITDELIPFVRKLANEYNGWTGYPDLIAFGCSLGATHAANLYFRRPDLFDALLALSGIYTAEYGFGSYMDDLVYQNSPLHFLGGMPQDHPYIALYNLKRAILCSGQGPWELPEATRQFGGVLSDRHIHAWVDLWGTDVSHDWYWWYKQVDYFVPYLLK